MTCVKKKGMVLNRENESSLTLLQNPTHLKEKYLYEYNEELLLTITLGVSVRKSFMTKH